MTILYLHREQGLNLSIDGPALVVRVEGRADRLFPLQRLQRIHVPAALTLDGRVITACMRAGVPLAFSDRRGRVLAWCLPANRKTRGLGVLLEGFCRQADHLDRYREWARQRLNAVVQPLAAHLGLEPGCEASAVETRIRLQAIRHAGETGARTSQEWLLAEIQGQLLQTLQAQGADAETVLPWAERLAPLLLLQMEPARLHWLRQRHFQARNQGRPRPEMETEALMEFFASRAQALNDAVTDLLEHFVSWLESQQP